MLSISSRKFELSAIQRLKVRVIRIVAVYDFEERNLNTVLVADCLMLGAIPSEPGDFGGRVSFAETLESIDNEAVSTLYCL